jgi:microcystin-dependent protein
VYRDPATQRGKIAEVFADTNVDLAPYVPVSGTVGMYLVTEPQLNLAAGTPVLVENAPNTHPDYDPLFTPYNLNPLERDECQLRVVSSVTGQQAVLAVVNLTAGQTAILASHINYNQRQLASPAAAIGALQAKDAGHDAQIAELLARIQALEGGLSVPIGGILEWGGNVSVLPNNFLLCNGQAVNRADYPLLFAAIGVTHGVGDGVNTFNLPNLVDRFPMGAGSVVAGTLGGTNQVALTEAQMPAHGHYLRGEGGGGTGTGYWAPALVNANSWNDYAGGNGGAVPTHGTTPANSDPTQANPPASKTDAVVPSGGGQSHENRPAFVALPFIIRAR